MSSPAELGSSGTQRSLPGHDSGRAPRRDTVAMDCVTCRAPRGEVLLTNAPCLELDEHWCLEHTYPVGIAGWVVLVLRRHARALHDLTDDEASALGRWLAVLPKALHAATGSEIEYMMQFADGDGFHHVHVHLVARAADLPIEWRGSRVFGALGVAHPVSREAASRVIRIVGEIIGVEPTPVGP